jgi:hypothetical protein
MKNDQESIHDQYKKVLTEAIEEPRYNTSMKYIVITKRLKGWKNTMNIAAVEDSREAAKQIANQIRKAERSDNESKGKGVLVDIRIVELGETEVTIQATE